TPSRSRREPRMSAWAPPSSAPEAEPPARRTTGLPPGGPTGGRSRCGAQDADADPRLAPDPARHADRRGTAVDRHVPARLPGDGGGVRDPRQGAGHGGGLLRRPRDRTDDTGPARRPAGPADAAALGHVALRGGERG